MKNKRLMIDDAWYTITRITASTYHVHKDGTAPTGYEVKLPSGCTCRSWKRPCKHALKVAELHSQESRESRIEAARQRVEEAMERAEVERTEAARLAAEEALYSLRVTLRFK